MAGSISLVTVVCRRLWKRVLWISASSLRLDDMFCFSCVVFLLAFGGADTVMVWGPSPVTLRRKVVRSQAAAALLPDSGPARFRVPALRL